MNVIMDLKDLQLAVLKQNQVTLKSNLVGTCSVQKILLSNISHGNGTRGQYIYIYLSFTSQKFHRR